MTANIKTLNANWLDNTTQGAAGIVSTQNCITPYQPYPAAYPSWTYSYSVPLKISLSLSEIVKLREAAKGDEAIKAILAKFTNSIEIVVDFA